MFFGILPLIILAGIVALIVRAVSRNTGTGSAEAGTVTIRRLFQYATLYGVLIVVAVGFIGILEEILPGGGAVIRRDTTSSARAIAFLVVGIPVYLGIGAWVRRQLEDPRERASLGWTFYLTASLLTGLIIAGFAAFEMLSWAFGAESYDRATMARGLVWAAVWVTHWFIAAEYLDRSRGQAHLLAGSAGGLIALSTALGFGITVVLDSLYSSLFDIGIAGGFGDDFGKAAAGFIVGGAVWWLYWLANSVQLQRTTLWHAFVLLLGVLGGLLTAVGAASTLLFIVLQWLFGNPDAATAVRHFDTLPALLGAGLVGLGIFGYHRAVLHEIGERARTEIRRVYEYIIAGVGLLGSAGGITVLLVALIQALLPSRALAGESEVDTLLGAVTFLVVGAPIWWYFWSRIQRIRNAQPESELRSTSRRTYLTILFGIGGVTALISLIIAVFRVVEDLLDDAFGAGTIYDIAPAIALVITTGAVAGYHWVVFSEDRAQEPAGLRSPLQEVILVGVAANGLAKMISDQLDARVQEWDRLDREGVTVDPARLLAELAEVTEERVLVMAWPGGHRIVAFARHK